MNKNHGDREENNYRYMSKVLNMFIFKLLHRLKFDYILTPKSSAKL